MNTMAILDWCRDNPILAIVLLGIITGMISSVAKSFAHRNHTHQCSCEHVDSSEEEDDEDYEDEDEDG